MFLSSWILNRVNDSTIILIVCSFVQLIFIIRYKLKAVFIELTKLHYWNWMLHVFANLAICDRRLFPIPIALIAECFKGTGNKNPFPADKEYVITWNVLRKTSSSWAPYLRGDNSVNIFQIYYKFTIRLVIKVVFRSMLWQ